MPTITKTQQALSQNKLKTFKMHKLRLNSWIVIQGTQKRRFRSRGSVQLTQTISN